MIEGYAEGEDPIVFHYKRGSFREYEDSKYSDLATGKNQPKKGLFRVLVSTKGNRTMFFVMLACVALVFTIGMLQGGENEGVLDEVHCSLSAFSFEETIYVSLKVKPSKNRKKTGSQEKNQFVATFYALSAEENGVSSGNTDFLFPETEEETVHFRFTDYDISSIKCVISDSFKNQIELKCPIEQK